jgi:hypothetical protein
VALVDVAGRADAALEVDAGALLNDVRGLVRGGVEIRRAGERDVVAAREAGGAHVVAGLPGGAVGVRLDAGDVEPAERALDRVEVGQARARAGGPALRGLVNAGGIAAHGAGLLALHRRTEGVLDERALADLLALHRRAERALDHRVLAGRWLGVVLEAAAVAVLTLLVVAGHRVPSAGRRSTAGATRLSLGAAPTPPHAGPRGGPATCTGVA